MPVVGHIVHYYRDAVQRLPIAAIVTAAYSSRLVTLTAFPVGREPEPHTSVSHASIAAHDACRWEWPPLR